jgi:putative transposase
MPDYLRWYQEGGTYFFTVKTYKNQSLFSDETARQYLHQAINEVRSEKPFEIPAIVLLPDHLHCIWSLPEQDRDFSYRWGRIKKRFTSLWLNHNGKSLPVSAQRHNRNERGVWQRRFWEHLIRDRDDFAHHMDYIHYNPLKHGYVECPHRWPYSSFHRWIKQGAYREDWLCSCRGKQPKKPTFLDNISDAGE